MKIIIDEDELQKFVKNPLAYKFVDDFLKSKTPVEEIADEEVRRAINWIKDLGEEKYKIYIEVIK